MFNSETMKVASSANNVTDVRAGWSCWLDWYQLAINDAEQAVLYSGLTERESTPVVSNTRPALKYISLSTARNDLFGATAYKITN